MWANGGGFEGSRRTGHFAIHPDGPLYYVTGGNLVSLDIGLGGGPRVPLPPGAAMTCTGGTPRAPEGCSSVDAPPFGVGTRTVLGDREPVCRRAAGSVLGLCSGWRRRHHRLPVLLPHTYFALEAAAVGSDEWHEVMSWRSDDPIPIPSQQVQVLNNQVVYAFANAKYVATTDAGHTWSTWDVPKDGPHLPYPNQAWIREVHVSSDGNGRMILNYRSNAGFALAELTTTDYGVHWATK